jgi:formamidopyrimidine-DNA glycosylase
MNRSLGNAINFRGLPPEISGKPDSRISLPTAEILLIAKKKSGIFLYHLTMEGTYITDSWHQTIEDAKRQAKFEFDNDPSNWKEVPDSYGDLDIVRLALEDEK